MTRTLRALSLSTTICVAMLNGAWACDIIPPMDADGNILSWPTLEDEIAGSHWAFVGTVKGFRTRDGEVQEKDPDCGGAIDWDDCVGSILSVVLSVDHPIKGIEGDRLYEEPYEAGDGDCGPYFEFGKRYVHSDSLFGTEELADEPTAKQLERWRSLEEPERTVIAREEEASICESRDPLAALADPWTEDAFVATIGQFRTDDTSLADLPAVCADDDSPECIAFTNRIVSLQIDLEASIKGDIAEGPHEIWWLSRDCQSLPKRGERYLVGGRGIWGWSTLDEPHLLLATPPTDEQLGAWRAAAALDHSE